MRRAVRTLAVMVAMAALPAIAIAQDFAGLRIGAPVTQAMQSLGRPADSGPANPGFTARRWQRADGTELSVTADAAGTIVYMEHFRGSRGQQSVGQGVRFGVTSAADMIALTGSAGLVFPGRGAVVQMGPDTVYFQSYDIVGQPGVLATFIFLAPVGQPAGRAVLDSMVIASQPYQSSIWGGPPQPTPGYRPIEMQF